MELIDGAGLKSVQNKAGMPSTLKDLSLEVAALLIDIRALNQAELNDKIQAVQNLLAEHQVLFPVEFTQDPIQYAQLWSVRKGLFPLWVQCVRSVLR